MFPQVARDRLYQFVEERPQRIRVGPENVSPGAHSLLWTDLPSHFPEGQVPHDHGAKWDGAKLEGCVETARDRARETGLRRRPLLECCRH